MASLTKREFVVALEELLPPMDPTAVTLKTVMAGLAQHLGVDLGNLKAFHKKELRQLIVDMLHLCKGGDDKENDPQSSEVDEDEEDEEEVKRQSSKRSRGYRIQESEDEDGDDVDESDDDDASGDSDDDERPPKRRRKAREPNGAGASPVPKKKKAAPAKRKTPVARKAADKPMDSEGLAALKELARVAGLLSPAVYAILKKCESEEAQEDVLRERLQDAGVRFSSPYPKKSDITAAKRKREKDKELDGIDTSLIITGGRSRRCSASRQTTYVTKYKDEDDEGGDGNKDGSEEIHDQNEEESEAEAHEASEASDESEAEF